MRKKNKLISLLTISILVALALLMAACTGGASYNSATPTSFSFKVTVPPGESALLVVNDPKLGNILVDNRGYTLYIDTKDPPDGTICSEQCKATWPPLVSTGNPVVGDALITGVVGTTLLDNGVRAVTYNHMVLYNFALALKVGDTSGNGYNSNQWVVARP